MGSVERRERERQDLKTRILDAARELFAEQGFEAVSMRRIAEKIEYSPATIYLHFHDKTDLIRQLCENDFLALVGRMTQIARIADPLERLGRAGQAYAEFALQHPNTYRMMFMMPGLPREAEEGLSIQKGNPDQDAYAFLAATIAEAIEAGKLRPELTSVALVSQTVWAAIHGVVSLEIAKADDAWIEWEPIKARIRSMIDLVMHGIARKGR